MKRIAATRAVKQAQRYADTLELLLDAMKMDTEQHFHLVLEIGCEFLRAQCGDDVQGYDLLKEERFYWNWFIRQWNERNEVFRAKNEESFIAEALFDYNAFGLTDSGSPLNAAEYLQAHYKEYHFRHCFYNEVMYKGYLDIVSSVIRRVVKDRHLITLK